MPRNTRNPRLRSARRTSTLSPIGWREWIELPELGIEATKAKVDTGARSSALHAEEIRPYRRAGRLWVRFRVHPLQRQRAVEVEARAPVLDRREVRSSSGQRQTRYVVQTELKVGDLRYAIELTLADRDTMGFRMLLGRQAVRGRFVVDPGRSFLLPKPAAILRKKKKKKREVRIPEKKKRTRAATTNGEHR